MRQAGPDYLAYALLDAIVDHYFPIVEAFGGELDRIEGEIEKDQGDEVVGLLHDIRSDLLLLRRLMWPHREIFNTLLRDEHLLIQKDTLAYLRDCHDHTLQIIDVAETYRDTCADLRDFHYTQVSLRTNDVMKVLTIISSVFIPLSFIVGLYGMNFDHSQSPRTTCPNFHWYYGYPFVLSLMGLLSGGMLLYFWPEGLAAIGRCLMLEQIRLVDEVQRERLVPQPVENVSAVRVRIEQMAGKSACFRSLLHTHTAHRAVALQDDVSTADESPSRLKSSMACIQPNS